MDPDLARLLAPLRRRIDELDDRLLDLLNERARLALAIGLEKRRAQVPVYDPRREEEILNRLAGLTSGPLPPLAVRRLFERILDESRRLERVSALVRESGSNGGGKR
jgi:chorismate mutase